MLSDNFTFGRKDTCGPSTPTLPQTDGWTDTHTHTSKTAETEAQPNVGLWKQRMVVLYWCVFGVGAGLKTEKQRKAQNNQVKGFFLWWWRGMVERMIMGVGEGRC